MSRDLLDIFFLVLVSHFNIAAVWLKVDCDSLPKSLILGRECDLQDAVNVIVSKNCQHT